MLLLVKCETRGKNYYNFTTVTRRALRRSLVNAEKKESILSESDFVIACSGRNDNELRDTSQLIDFIIKFGVPRGIRTPVIAVKVRPGPKM